MKNRILNKANKNYQRLYEICSADANQAIQKMDSSFNGLSSEKVESRLKEFGSNLLFKGKKHNIIVDLALRFKNPLVIQLLVICIVSLIMGDLRSTTVVGGMIFLSVFLAFFQEKMSDKAAFELQKLVQTITTVIRDGKEEEIKIKEVVPGDIVVLQAGSIIPADCRVIQAKDFFVSQSALTGESMPIEKFTEAFNLNINEPLSFANACFQGSNVISGSAKALIINTGINTFLGSISTTLSESKENTSFDKGIKSFVWLMIRFMLIMVTTVFMIVGFTKYSSTNPLGSWMSALLFSLSVAVGLTPEMLPMIVTVCLSKGTIAMSKKKVIVKKLKAIQNFGAINILCTDKTGTLTQDNIVLERYVDVTNRKSQDVLRYAYMNSFYQTGLKNLLDKSILSHEELDVERTCKKIDELPFDFVRKKMSVVIEYEGTNVMICKGAVEEIYSVCDRYQIDDDIYPLIDVIKNDLFEEYQSLSADGYRVLAIAYKEFPKTKDKFSAADENSMILLGYLAFFDPPKDSASKAIKALNASGVEVKILTGDNELVTKKVCHDVNLEISNIVTGRQLSEMDEEKFRETVKTSNVFARLTPSQKEKIIQTLRGMGNVVGFMGDGINDAPAMKAADVGISVDTAVDIAKESADIILLEKSLLVLEDGIIEGRKIFSNIIKYIKMGASSNFGNMFSVVGGSYFLPFLPMAPIQILINNLLYDFSQTGIPTDSVDEEFVKKPHKWNISFIQKFMIFIGPISSIFDYATFFLMLYFFNCILFKSPDTSPAMKDYYEKLFHTGWFVESLLTQTLIVHIIRTNKIPFFQSRASVIMTMSTLIVMAVAVILPYSPIASYIGLVPLPVIYWAWIVGFLILYSILTHLMKTFFNRKINTGE
jgi:Mg2+-importing ATPase